MSHATSSRQWWLRHFAYLLAATILCTCLLSVVLTRAADPEQHWDWARPVTMAIRRVSSLGSSQSEPNFLNNLDCTLTTYRVPGSSTMQTGCFTPTAFGLLDSDSDTVIFNGTDEGLPLLAHSNNQVLVPWPGALDLVVLDAVSTGGSRLSMYKNPLESLQDQRNLLLQLTAKQLTAPPELQLTDRAGQALVINPQTIAFSDGGSWLIAETLGGSFVRINLATLDMTAFAPAFGAQGSPALLKSRVAVSSDGRYVAIANNVAGSFKVYDLTTCSGTPVNLQPENCQSYDYQAFAGQQIHGLRSIRHLRFVNDGLLSFEVTTDNPDNDGIYELAPAASINSLIDYLGLGDSYTSGEGAFDYRAGTDTTDNTCHISARSYPLLLTADLFSSRGGHSVACSGAVINDVGSTADSYRGQVRNGRSYSDLRDNDPALLASVMTNFLPGYVAQQRFVGQYQPGIMTVSVGGNDIGFGQILKQCVMPHVSRHLNANTCFNTYEDRQEVIKLVDRTVPRWAALYKQLAAKSPGGRLYVIGYPSVAVDNGDCALNVHLSKSELEFSEELVIYLNGAIRQAAGKAGIIYVDISQALAGHRLCETASYNVAVNGLTAGTDAGLFGIGVLGEESYHPNALGQALIEQAILQQTHNLSDVAAVPATAPDSQALLKAPKTGRAVYNRVPAANLAPKVVKSGQNAALSAKGSDSGLKSHTTYNIRVDGPAGPVVGTVVSDSTGDIGGSAMVPLDTSAGAHTIDLTGENQAGEAVDITQPIYVSANDNDLDGDGLPDSTDSCPAAINSGVDSDRDGTDDICDGFIGTAAPSSGNSAGQGFTAGAVTSPAAPSPGGGPGPKTPAAVHSASHPGHTAGSVATKPATVLKNNPLTIRSRWSLPAYMILALAIWLLIVLSLVFIEARPPAFSIRRDQPARL